MAPVMRHKHFKILFLNTIINNMYTVNREFLHLEVQLHLQSKYDFCFWMRRY